VQTGILGTMDFGSFGAFLMVLRPTNDDLFNNRRT